VQLARALDTLASALTVAPARPLDPAGALAPHDVAEPRARVLVVEDSPVNQRVAVGLLARLGIAADVAGNGRAGLEALEQARYDLVLMDCLMPELDGFEATEELRRREVRAGRSRTPVIALTASAQASDREHCLRSGMDDFLTKPIQRRSLQEAVDRWLPNASATNGTAGEAVAGAASHAPTDPHPAGEGAVIDVSVIRSILDLDADGATGLFDELLASFRADDRDLVCQIGHTFRGEALAWGAEQLAGRCRRLEDAASSGQPIDGVSVDDLAARFRATVAALESLRVGTA
jgi:CheY-like chemotaxis protein